MSQHELPAGVGVTAITVANERRVETERPDSMFRDELAQAFCAAARRLSGPNAFPGFDVTLSDHVPVMRGYMALRTRLFDDQLLAACAAGCRQVVILAAGLDARAFRLPWPAGLRLFELDVADVLAFKGRVLSEVGATPSCERREVAVDLRDDWPAALREAGFDAGAPTAWLVEGLLLYLTQEENDRIFAAIAALSAPGSHLGVEHISTSMLTLTAMARGRDETLARAGVTWKSAIEEPIAWLAQRGWKGELLEAEALSAALKRDVPPVLDTSQGKPQLWLLRATR